MNVFRWRLSDLAIAAAAIAARAPFLLRGDRFFDADEAVEGLMARHLGDHSLFLWGQRYKGTPEVFLTSAVFHAGGPGVIPLKAVTLACFVVFLCLNFRLLERMFSPRIAWIATAFFIAGPPSLVFWTLSGSAEMEMTWVAGSILLLGVEKRSPVAAGLALGLGLWVQQYILFYVVALAITIAIQSPDLLRALKPRSWLRPVLIPLAAAAALYVVLGLIAFFSGGFDIRIASVRITATHPQKMWWIAGAIVAVSIAIASVASLGRQLLMPALAFLAGYSPAIIGRIGNHGLGAPISRLDFHGLVAALPDMTGVMLPMLLGFRDPSAHRTVFQPLVLALAVVAAWSYLAVWRRHLNPFFHLFPVVTAVMFLVSGSYIDAQSYRYLMPIYAAVPVIFAVGVDDVWRSARPAGAVLLIFMLAIFATQQAAWYQHLEPDTATAQTIACLDRAGVTAARAPYWRSYTITFLTGERIIVSPIDGIDRYSPYSELTRSSATVEQAGCVTR